MHDDNKNTGTHHCFHAIITKSVYDKVRAFDDLAACLSFEALESEGLLPDGMTKDELAKVQANLKVSYYEPFWYFIEMYMRGLNRDEYISTVLGLANTFPFPTGRLRLVKPVKQKYEID